MEVGAAQGEGAPRLHGRRLHGVDDGAHRGEEGDADRPLADDHRGRHRVVDAHGQGVGGQLLGRDHDGAHLERHGEAIPRIGALHQLRHRVERGLVEGELDRLGVVSERRLHGAHEVHLLERRQRAAELVERIHRVALAPGVEGGHEVAQHQPEGRRLPHVERVVAEGGVELRLVEEQVQPGRARAAAPDVLPRLGAADGGERPRAQLQLVAEEGGHPPDRPSGLRQGHGRYSGRR